ncbi:unnamed protein product, partial [Symbiodinium necroappetens]
EKGHGLGTAHGQAPWPELHATSSDETQRDVSLIEQGGVEVASWQRYQANMPYVQIAGVPVIPEALEMANQGHPTEYIMEFLAYRRGDPTEERTRRIDARYEEELELGLLWRAADTLLHCRVPKGPMSDWYRHIGVLVYAQPGERRVLAAVRATDVATFTLAKDADLSNTGRRRSPRPELLQKAHRFTKWAKERLILAVAEVDVVQHIVRHSAYESHVASRHLHARQEIVVSELDVQWAKSVRSKWTVRLPDHRPELQAAAPALLATPALPAARLPQVLAAV